MGKKYINDKFPHFLHGGDYNPDQWQAYPEVLNEDMRLMKLANCNEMTLGIFAWAALEPEEGVFNFSFMDKAMDDIYNAGGRVILATPSGARPAWLSHKYPEVLRWTNKFEQKYHGERHNHCFTSPIYREKVGIINRKIAERYKDHPALIAWHLSNEYGGDCHCPNCQKAFREWLKQKYGTLDNLNHQWWNAFWSHTYTDWDQIRPPSPIGEGSTHALNIDWRNFSTDQTTDFMKHEIEAVREFTPDVPVTTNLMGFFNDLDYHKLVQPLDFVSNDLYPAWNGNEQDDINTAKQSALIHDLIRSLKHRSFLLMESTPSVVNWRDYNKLKRPGMHELSSLQAIAHGSDSVQYFQWRKSRGSSEKFHGAVVDHVGNENTRVFNEVRHLGARLKAMDEVTGTHVNSDVAILFDWNNRWATNFAQGFILGDKKIMDTIQNFYSPLWDRGINTDVIGFKDDFSNYKVIIAPMLYSLSEHMGEKIKKYVHDGGVMLCTYMTGMVNENDLCYMGGFPGAGLREVFGIWNEEIDTLYPNDVNSVVLTDGSDTVFDAVDYCELIHAETADILAEYGSDFYAGRPAVTVNKYGDGKAYYVAFRDKGDFTDKIVEKLLADEGVRASFDEKLPYGVTAHSRTDGEKVCVFLQNFSHSNKTVKTRQVWTNIETGETVGSAGILLKPLETICLAKHRT